MTRLVAVPLLLFTILGFPTLGAIGAEPPATPQAWVDEALAAAGDNRAELEAVLRHFASKGDAQELEGARFLIANMPDHGYVITELQDEAGTAIPYDPLAYDTFQASLAALEALEEAHGPLRFSRAKKRADLQTIPAAYLIDHIEQAFAAWRDCPPAYRVTFEAFRDHVLPYRGSQEPHDAWIGPLRERYAGWFEEAEDARAVWRRLSKDVHERVRFNERYYLHPTDQGFSEMLASGQGRCEDITNMMTYASRSLALATAADYTPAWAHRDNNHAWNVLLDRDGRGSDPSNAHAAKVYRKTYALQRDSLPFLLRDGEEVPNRWMASKTSIDVTDQYRSTTDVTVDLYADVVEGHRFAYLCVFNGGRWVPIHWGRIEGRRVTFDRMGRDIVYLACVFGDEELTPAADAFLLHANGSVQHLPGTGGGSGVVLQAVRPRQKSVDTHVETPVSWLASGETYLLHRWTRTGWRMIHAFDAGEEAPRLDDLPVDGLYWLVPPSSRRLERVFTIREGRQRWW